MRINKDSLKARANNIARKLNISHNIIYSRFFYDAFLTRLASSPYKDQFVLKGGLYLSSISGIDTRSTMDIDFYLKKISMEKDKIINVINEVCSLDVGDGISFQIIDVNNIRLDDIYGGFQLTLIGRLENVRSQFGIDVATGDPITPCERNYNYQCLVSDEILPLKAYSLETVISEKLETILARGISNSRCKDYYDLYLLYMTQKQNIDIGLLKIAFKRTCEYRKFTISNEDALSLINEIDNNIQMANRWTSYCKNAEYARKLSFDMVVDTVKNWIEIVF